MERIWKNEHFVKIILDKKKEIMEGMMDKEKIIRGKEWFDGDMASKLGYLDLMIKKEKEMIFSENAFNWACERGNLDVVKWLYKRMDTPFECLDYACKTKNNKVVSWLIKNKIKSECSTATIEYLCYVGDLKTLKKVLIKMEKCNDICFLNASMMNNLNIMKYLVERGLKVYADCISNNYLKYPNSINTIKWLVDNIKDYAIPTLDDFPSFEQTSTVNWVLESDVEYDVEQIIDLYINLGKLPYKKFVPLFNRFLKMGLFKEMVMQQLFLALIVRKSYDIIYWIHKKMKYLINRNLYLDCYTIALRYGQKSIIEWFFENNYWFYLANIKNVILQNPHIDAIEYIFELFPNEELFDFDMTKLFNMVPMKVIDFLHQKKLLKEEEIEDPLYVCLKYHPNKEEVYKIVDWIRINMKSKYLLDEHIFSIIVEKNMKQLFYLLLENNIEEYYEFLIFQLLKINETEFARALFRKYKGKRIIKNIDIDTEFSMLVRDGDFSCIVWAFDNFQPHVGKITIKLAIDREHPNLDVVIYVADKIKEKLENCDCISHIIFHNRPDILRFIAERFPEQLKFLKKNVITFQHPIFKNYIEMVRELDRLNIFQKRIDVLRCALSFDKKEIFLFILENGTHSKFALLKLLSACVNRNANEFYITVLRKYLEGF